MHFNCDFRFLIVLLIPCAGSFCEAAQPPVTAIAFAPDGQSVVIGSQAGLQIRSWPELKSVRKLETELIHVHDVVFHPGGNQFAAVGGTPSEAGAAELFSWPDGKLLSRFSLHEDLIFAAAWQPHADRLATAGLDLKVILTQTTGDIQPAILEGHSRGVKACCFLPDGNTLITAGIDQSLRIWDMKTNKVVRTMENHTRPVHDLVLRSAQQEGTLPMVVSISEDRTVRLWQPTIGRMVRFVRFRKAVPLDAGWTVDGNRIAVSCNDGHVRIIDPDTVEILHDFPAIDGWAYSLAVHPGGKSLLLGGEDGQLNRIDLPVSAP